MRLVNNPTAKLAMKNGNVLSRHGEILLSAGCPPLFPDN
jgi:hypothetical protein